MLVYQRVNHAKHPQFSGVFAKKDPNFHVGQFADDLFPVHPSFPMIFPHSFIPPGSWKLLSSVGYMFNRHLPNYRY